jgi:hypothetical protein
MLLTEITISRLPKNTADVRASTNQSDYADRLPSPEDIELSNHAIDQEDDLPIDDELGLDDVDPELDDQLDGEDQFADEAEPESTDPNKMGLIRVVPGSHLVYKRAMPDGTFTELWTYKAEDVKTTMNTRNSILSGTDIEKSKLRSEDNAQTYDVWSVGNIELLYISGLPN